MTDYFVPGIDDSVEYNSKLLALMLALVDQAGDIACLPSQVTASLRQALPFDGVGFAWLAAGAGQVWNFEVDCVDPDLAAELNAIKNPLELAAVLQVVETGQAVHRGAAFADSELALFGGLTRVYRLAALPVRNTDFLQAVALAINCKDEPFDDSGLRVFEAVCCCLALRLENGYLLRKLGGDTATRGSYDLVKDRVVQRFSHELKTPLAVLIASIKLLRRNPGFRKDPDSQRVLARAERSVQRLLNMEYELEDILREPD